MITDKGNNPRCRPLHILVPITIITLLTVLFKVLWESGQMLPYQSRYELSLASVISLTAILTLSGLVFRWRRFSDSPVGCSDNIDWAIRDDRNCAHRAGMQKQPAVTWPSINDVLFSVKQPDMGGNIPGQQVASVKPGDEPSSHLLTRLTHELRTPMIGILGSVDLLEHSPLTPVQMASIETIRICGERLLHTIDNMLEASKTNSGVPGINWSPGTQPDMAGHAIETSPQAAAVPEDDLFSIGFLPVSVLLVEDNELNRKLLGQMLINYGFEVLTAGNGLECLNLLRQKNIDIILMDMQMPLMDGYETTRIIRENPDWKHLPIIAITANSLSGDRQKCLDYGCSSYLAKPFKSETLVREIKAYLQNQFIRGKNADLLSQQLIADLLPEFMEMLSENMKQLKTAIDEKNMTEIKNISHGLKGTAGMYGFMQISELASYLEQAVRDKNYQRMSLLYQQIISFVQQFNSCMTANKVV